MARHWFGGTIASWVVTTADASAVFGPGTRAVVLPTSDVTLNVYDAPDGTQVTDLLDGAGTAISQITVVVGSPYIPPFQGPDDVPDGLWVFAPENGPWLEIPRYDVDLANLITRAEADARYLPHITTTEPLDVPSGTSWILPPEA